jgi:hypothetical protein
MTHEPKTETHYEVTVLRVVRTRVTGRNIGLFTLRDYTRT